MPESESYGDPSERIAKPSLRVLECIAEAEGVDPIELDPPLYHIVDPTALDQLFEPAGRNEDGRRVSVSFRYCGYDVTVRSDGRVDAE